MNKTEGGIPTGYSRNSYRRAYLLFKSKYQLFLFALLPRIWLFVFKYVPMAGLQVAFRKYRMRSVMSECEWVGLKYFAQFFSSYEFERIIGNTLTTSIYSLLAGFPVPILLALGLNAIEGVRFKKFVQTLTYIPHFISTVVLVGMLPELPDHITMRQRFDLRPTEERHPYLGRSVPAS